MRVWVYDEEEELANTWRSLIWVSCVIATQSCM